MVELRTGIIDAGQWFLPEPVLGCVEGQQDRHPHRVPGSQCAGQYIRLVMQLLQDGDHPLAGSIRNLSPVVDDPVDGPC